MNTLIKSIEEWVDQRVFSNNEYFVTKFKEMEEIHIRDSNRIALLESRVQLYLDSPSPKADAGESMHEADQILSELVDRVDEMDSRIDDVNGLLDEAVYRDDLHDMIENVVSEVDLESRIIDAVKEEIDAIDFKITVER